MVVTRALVVTMAATTSGGRVVRTAHGTAREEEGDRSIGRGRGEEKRAPVRTSPVIYRLLGERRLK